MRRDVPLCSIHLTRREGTPHESLQQLTLVEKVIESILQWQPSFQEFLAVAVIIMRQPGLLS